MPDVKAFFMFRVLSLTLLLLGQVIAAQADTPMPVVATFSILGDLVKTIGGDRVSVETLVGPNGDAHSYTPKPTDVKRLAAAKAVFINGLDFERWLGRMIDVSAKDKIVIATTGIAALPSSSGAPDPHAWQSVANVRIYIVNIRNALIDADPKGEDTYHAQTRAYLAQLDDLDRDIHATIARIPESRRRVVTPHPSFGYFGAAYNVTFVSPQHLGNEAEASAKAVASLIDTIRREKISALFVEGSTNSRLIQRIAVETGVRIGGALYSDALTDVSGPASTYIAMMRANLRTIETALRD